MDKGHLTTDKLLLTMEKKLTAIYSRANKEVSEKMTKYLNGLEEKGASLQDAIKQAKSAEERAKAEAAYKSFVENKTLKNAHFAALTENFAENLKRVNETAADYVNDRLPSVYALNYNDVGGDISGKVKGYSFEMADASTVKSLATKDETLLPYKTVNGKKDVRWNTQSVNSEILQGIIQGESIPDISKRLTHVTEMNLSSAIRNARTSTTCAENRGRMDSYHRAQDMGVIIHKVWLATNDQRTREEHAELDGQEREIDEPFENSLGEIMYPGDPDADPANVYNCRCTMITKVIGFNVPGAEYNYDYDEEYKDEAEKVSISEEVRQSVTIDSASEDWFEYEYADAMKTYIETGKMPTMDINGNEMDNNLRQKLAAEAELIQETGEKTKTQYKTLYRGMVLEEQEAREMFTPGEYYKFNTLSATATDKNISNIYMNPENLGGGGLPVIIEIQKPDGIYGFDRDGIEVVLPKFSEFKVVRNYMDEDGVVHISLYAKKGKNVKH